MKHVWTNGKIRDLRPILVEWVKLNNQVARSWAKTANDCPWWYNERALLSLFAGAVWRTGNEAFEEFVEMKHGAKRATQRNGRVDIWFSTNQNSFRGEAKHAEIPLGRPRGHRQTISRLLRAAVKDAQLNPVHGAVGDRIAMAFVVPYATQKMPIAARNEHIATLTSLVEEFPLDARAWTFPTMAEHPAPDGYVCPGIILMLKRVHRTRWTLKASR